MYQPMRRVMPGVVAALLLAFGLSGCSKGTASTQDQTLTNAVEAKIKADPALAGSDVTASAQNGVVTLTGTVNSEQARMQAAQDATIPGVMQVNNQIATDSSLQPGGAAPAASTTMAAASHPESRRAGRNAQSGGANPPAPAVKAVAPVEVETGAPLHVRLAAALSSATASAGQSFQATLAEPVLVNGQIAIPQGATLTGTVTAADSAGHFKGQSRLVLTLTQVSYDGQSYDLQTNSITRLAGSRSKRSTELIGGGAAVGALIGALAGHGKGAAIGAASGAGAGTAAQALTKPAEVELPAEAPLTFDLKAPVQVVPQAGGGN